MLWLRIDRVGACVHGVDPRAALAADEYARWSGFASTRRRRQFLAGRRVLRQMLAVRADAGQALVAVEPDGALRVATPPGLWVSISHSDEWVAAALADRPVGVDIEVPRPGRDLARLAEFIGAPSDREADVYTTWTLKEAALKRRGLGLDLGRMRAIGVQPDDPGTADAHTALVEFDCPARQLHIAVVADHVADLSVECPTPWCREAVMRWRLTEECTTRTQPE